MQLNDLSPTDLQALDELLGHLNFSTGGSDRKFLSNLNQLYRALGKGDRSGSQHAAKGEAVGPPLEAELPRLLLDRLNELETRQPAFSDARQAREVIELVHNHVLKQYREFHRDLLFHQDEAALWGPLFLGRVYEAALAQRGREGDEARDPASVATEIVARLNDYIGHRPLAVLVTRQSEPYPHEWHRPLPLYIRGVGVAAGKYAALIARTIEILEATDPQLLAEVHFDPKRLDELAVDARAYDFDHPANKRPNYQFGHWDPHQIDNQGYYRRFVIRQVVLDAVLQRIEMPGDEPAARVDPGERLFESAAALAGTILMSAELSGAGPATHSSDMTLGKLIAKIAVHRDRFYEQLLQQKVPGQARLLAEAQQRRQPMGGVRQYLNAELGRQRADQLQHVQLAQLYARLGQTEAAARQIAAVPTARARMTCQIQCLLSTAGLALDGGRIAESATALAEITQLVHRGIECGAIVDPWNILGCDASFSLFPALENSVHDHRIDELLELVADILALAARTWALAAAAAEGTVERQVGEEMVRFAGWWDQFASTTVSSVEGIAAGPICDAARAAAAALAAWHRGGATAGDIAFWRPYVETFDSPRAFQLVIDALLDHGDLVASMALVMQWLSQADRVTLRDGTASFPAAASRWLGQVLEPKTADPWRLVVKFFDSLEANAEEYWRVPRFEFYEAGGPARRPPGEPDHGATATSGPGVDDELSENEDVDDGETDLFAAAYDGMVFRDSGDDGNDADLLGPGGGSQSGTTDHEFEQESRRIAERLAFLVTLAQLWGRTALWLTVKGSSSADERGRIGAWFAEIVRLRDELSILLDIVGGYQVFGQGVSPTALAEYERRRSIRESLLERIVSTAIAFEEASLLLLAVGEPAVDEKDIADKNLAVWQPPVAAVLRAAMAGDAVGVRHLWPALLRSLEGQPLLYVPLGKLGVPEFVVSTRALQRALGLLLGLLPRLGMLVETVELVRLTGSLERSQRMAPGMVTEFDQLVKEANQALAECIVAAQRSGPAQGKAGKKSGKKRSKQESKNPAEKPLTESALRDADAEPTELIADLEALVQAVLSEWLTQSRMLRLSVLERVFGEEEWQELVEFVRTYGHDLFNQQFLQLPNIRAILHRGVDAWLADVEREEAEQADIFLIQALRDGTAPPRAKELLQLVLEAVAENHSEFRDYNNTTTQSDRGELLYMFLDFVRLRVRYDRIDWNVAPVVQVYEVLVRQGQTAAAELWYRELALRTAPIADELLARLEQLTREYGMRLPTVADRLRERFVQPLLLDRARALVRPAYDEFHAGKSRAAAKQDGGGSARFLQLQQEIDELSREPVGVGLDVPAWLAALQDEVDAAVAPEAFAAPSDAARQAVPQQRLTPAEVERQLEMIHQLGEEKSSQKQ